MQSIKLETRIDKKGNIYLPKKFQYAYGRVVSLVVYLPEQVLPEQVESTKKRRQPGSAKGILHILSEDDEHLDDFKEYMP